MQVVFKALAFAALAIAGVADAACDLVLSQSMAKYSQTQGYSLGNVYSDWPRPQGPFKMLAPQGTCKVSDGSIYGYFPKGKISGYETGFTWYSILPKPLLSATMSYDVHFAPGFDWAYGGKLPGFCGLDCPVGCSTVSRDRGWSTRLMWRKRGGMTTYAYYPDKPQTIRCGEDWWWSNGLQSGRWHNLRLYVKVNTPGKADGVTRAWLDGRLVLEKRNVMYRYRSEMSYGVTRAYLTTYAGGSDVERFAPDHDQWIKFRNFRVWEGDCDRPYGQPSSAA